MADDNELDAEMESMDREDEDVEDEDWRDGIEYAVDYEGFDEAFSHPGAFEDIKDEKFQELRVAYLVAIRALKEYIANNLGGVDAIRVRACIPG